MINILKMLYVQPHWPHPGQSTTVVWYIGKHEDSSVVIIQDFNAALGHHNVDRQWLGGGHGTESRRILLNTLRPRDIRCEDL